MLQAGLKTASSGWNRCNIYLSRDDDAGLLKGCLCVARLTARRLCTVIS